MIVVTFVVKTRLSPNSLKTRDFLLKADVTDLHEAQGFVELVYNMEQALNNNVKNIRVHADILSE